MKVIRGRRRDTPTPSRRSGEAVSAPTATVPDKGSLEQQAAFFRAFGALRVPGLFADDIDTIQAGFEEMFRDYPSEAVCPTFSLHRRISPDLEMPRSQIKSNFIEPNAKLAWLRDDPRVTDLVGELLGDGWTYDGSAGNLFSSYIYWHTDYFRSVVPPETHLKLAFYLDDLDADSGALRVIPGTNHPGPFRSSLYDETREPSFRDLERKFGLPEEHLPCWAIAVRPGDLIVFDDATLHANFNGGMNRRMFSMAFAQARPND
jgi:hypothetical protein